MTQSKDLQRGCTKYTKHFRRILRAEHLYIQQHTIVCTHWTYSTCLVTTAWTLLTIMLLQICYFPWKCPCLFGPMHLDKINAADLLQYKTLVLVSYGSMIIVYAISLPWQSFLRLYSILSDNVTDYPTTELIVKCRWVIFVFNFLLVTLQP